MKKERLTTTAIVNIILTIAAGIVLFLLFLYVANSFPVKNRLLLIVIAGVSLAAAAAKFAFYPLLNMKEVRFDLEEDFVERQATSDAYVIKEARTIRAGSEACFLIPYENNSDTILTFAEKDLKIRVGEFQEPDLSAIEFSSKGGHGRNRATQAHAIVKGVPGVYDVTLRDSSGDMQVVQRNKRLHFKMPAGAKGELCLRILFKDAGLYRFSIELQCGFNGLKYQFSSGELTCLAVKG